MKPALKGEDLIKYFTKRETTISDLDRERSELAKTLLDLIPNELDKLRSEYFRNPEGMVEWIQGLYDHRVLDWGASDRIKMPEDYGFKDKTDAYQKLQLLKKAWKGLIDLKFNRSNWYLEVFYQLAKDPSKSPKRKP